MAVAFRSAGSSANAGSGSLLTLGLPTGAQSGDYLIAFLHSQASTATTDWSPPVGWTKIGPTFTASSANQRVTSIFAKFAGSSEPSTLDFTAPNVTGRMVGVVHAYTGVNTVVPIAASSGFTATSSASTTINVSTFSSSANLFTIEMMAAQYTSPNSYALSSNTSGLTLQSEVYRASGATQNPPSEDTAVSRTALRVWRGTAGSGGVSAHAVTTGTFAQACVAMVALNADQGVQPNTTPTIIGHTTAQADGSSSTFTVDPAHNLVGSAVADDDWIIAVFTSAGSLAGTKTPTPPAGWNQIAPLQTMGTGTATFGVWAHKRASGETTYVWSQTTAEPQNSYHRLIYVRGAGDFSIWNIGALVDRADTGEATSITAPSVTTLVDHTLAVVLAGERTTAAETDGQVTCNNFTKQWFENITSDHTLFVATKDIQTPAASGSVTVSYPNSHVNNGIALILGIPGGDPLPLGLPLKISDGTSLQDARFRLADGAGGFIEPGAYKVVRPGYSSVTQMLAQTTFYCAHRGGSRDFPEMSLYAYGQSALLGYPALELSLARTSDGVWFGLHDSTLDRTSGVTGIDPATLTWAQVQSYQILGSMATNNTSQANRPYMRWEELMAMYYTTHVIFVDPKVAIGFRSELLNMMDAMPGTPTDHFVAKYYGIVGGPSNLSGWNFDAKSRGYKTWGYFYEADSANFATYAPRWDILGMDYAASQTAWNNLAAAAPGKPIMGHICPNAAAVSTALSKGAVGVMVSGVVSAVPPAIT